MPRYMNISHIKLYQVDYHIHKVEHGTKSFYACCINEAMALAEMWLDDYSYNQYYEIISISITE